MAIIIFGIATCLLWCFFLIIIYRRFAKIEEIARESRESRDIIHASSPADSDMLISDVSSQPLEESPKHRESSTFAESPHIVEIEVAWKTTRFIQSVEEASSKHGSGVSALTGYGTE